MIEFPVKIVFKSPELELLCLYQHWWRGIWKYTPKLNDTSQLTKEEITQQPGTVQTSLFQSFTLSIVMLGLGVQRKYNAVIKNKMELIEDSFALIVLLKNNTSLYGGEQWKRA